MATDREVKLGVWPGFELPDLRGAVDGVTPSGPEEWRIEAVYFDTVDLRLLRRGVTVRFRRGAGSTEVWTAMLPEDVPMPGLAHREVAAPGGPTSVPGLLADLVRGWALGAPLVPVARLRTLRQRTTLRRRNGNTVAVVDDDEVSIVQRSRVAARFRELELVLVDGAPNKLLARVTDRMCAAGAQPVNQTPKLVRALGPAALAPWDLARSPLDSSPTAGQLLTDHLLASAASVIDHLAAVILDQDPEGIHQCRVGIRRLRSDMKTARSLLDQKKTRPLRRELSWLMDGLGEVRDLDVLLARLRLDIDSLDQVDRAGADTVMARAREDRAAAYDRLRADLRTERCSALLEEMTCFAKDPPFRSKAAGKPAADVLPRLVREPWRDLHRLRRGLPRKPDDDALHRLRIDVKRVRYATELAAAAAGKQARRAAKRLAKVQTVLGEHHDACVAEERLRGLAQRSDPDGTWAAGVLGGLAVARASECRGRLPGVWRPATARKRWRWIK